jgi:hypothetical protein
MPRSTLAASLAALFVSVTTSLALVSCGGGNNPGGPSPSPSPSPSPQPSPGPSGGTIITITAAGVSPKNLVVARGSRVTFTNNGTIGYDMNSDPHPAHTDCPDISVGFVSPGQSKDTQVLNTARTCGYHDHNQPSNTTLQGTIQIQ